METKGEGGHPYPPSTLRSLLSGIHRVLQSNHAPFYRLDNTNPCFCDLLKTLDDMVPAQFHQISLCMTLRSTMSTLNSFLRIISTNKCVRAYALPASSQCIVKLLDNYLHLLPPNSVSFYLRSLDEFPTGPKKYSFVSQRIGVNVLKNIAPDMSRQCECDVHSINHSLRATAIM